jgi:cysteine synthase A
MGRVYNSILETIGRTPLVRLSKMSRELPGTIYAKLEMFNPGSSVKDRIALAMVEAAEAEGAITPGVTTIIEPTSGNTGIGLALVAIVKGYKAVIVLPDTMSQERMKMLAALGAEVVATPGAKGFAGVIAKVEELQALRPNMWAPLQFKNAFNPGCHYDTTGPEIWDDMDGKVDLFVSGIGTGGTLCGTGRYLKERNPALRVVAVEPENCALLSGGPPGLHKIQGLLAGFLADTIDQKVIDEVITCPDEQAFELSRFLLKSEGIFSGISAGASLHGALILARREENRGKNIVTIFPDSGERYLSTPLCAPSPRPSTPGTPSRMRAVMSRFFGHAFSR